MKRISASGQFTSSIRKSDNFRTGEPDKLSCGKRHPRFSRLPDTVAALCGEPLGLTGNDEPETLTYFHRKHGPGRQVAAVTPNLEGARRLSQVL